MKNRLPYQTLVAAILLMIMALPGYAKPTWTFSVVVAVEKQTAHLYESMLSKPIDQIVRNQITTVNANFNSIPNFTGIYAFRIDSVYVFDGSASTELFRPHPNYSYGLVIDGFSTTAQGGGWLGSYQVIYHKWSASKFFESGPFGPGATDGLTHEFAHARGAVDIYGMRVDGSKNPINGETFEPVNSIMTFPYGDIVWDEYTTNLLNSTGYGLIKGEDWITRAFPAAINLRTVDARGQSLENVRLEMYPVDWFSNSVSPTPVLHYSTTPFGSYSFSSNPYQPSTNGYPWTMRYANFLIKATYQSTVVYKWLPLYDVQNDYFRNGPQSTYTALIQFPADMPVIHINQLNNSSFASGDVLTASFSVAGSFNQGNTFSLQVIDPQNNTFVLQIVTGTQGSTLTGILPTFTATQRSKIRIVSSDPVARSSDYGIVINPGQLQLLAPYYDCQNGYIRFHPDFGDGSPITYSAPGIKRTAATDNFGYIEKELLRDPKMIPITATQSGFSITYNFDLPSACNTPLRPPVLNQPIPDQVFTVGQPVPGNGFDIGRYFTDPTPFSTGYNSGWSFDVWGLPHGLYVSSGSETGGPNPVRVIMGTPTLAIAYLVTVKASTAAFPNKPVITQFRITVAEANSGSPLTVLKPTYTCQTGAISFNTSGGDGSPVTYQAPGIARAAATDNVGTVEAGLRGDPKPITIQAIQSGHSSSFVFDLASACAAANGPLVLLLPTYSCETGAFRFNTSGGDGSPIEYRAVPGITDWTTNPNALVDREIRTAADAPPIFLQARQGGREVNMSWNIRGICPIGSRRAAGIVDRNNADLQVRVLGNPVESSHVEVEVTGATGQSVELVLTNLRGQLRYRHSTHLSGTADRFRIPLGDQQGMFLLTIQSTSGWQQIKVIRP